MKKLIAFLFLIVLLSCEKEDTSCWECNIFTTYETIWLGQNYSEKDYSLKTEIICEHTEKQIRDFEEIKTYISDTIYIIQNFVRHGYVIKSTCHCIK